MRQRGGEILALSADDVDDAKRLVAELALPFRVLSARELPVLADYGLAHPGGGLEGETIAVPAQLLLRADGSIAWRYVSRRITDRMDPAATLRALAQL